MGCLATSSFLSNQLIPFSTTIVNSTTNSKLEASFRKVYKNTTKEKFCLAFFRDNYEVRIGRNCAIKSSRGVSSLKTQQEHDGTWEEPDIGSDSEDEYEEEDESLDEETKAGVNITSQDDEYERIKKGTFVFHISFISIGVVISWF
jgi:hypothetical protein